MKSIPEEKRPHLICAALALAGWVWAAPPTVATSYVAMSDAELLADSPLVVVGHIVFIQPSPVADLLAIDYLVFVDQIVKGHWEAPAVVVRVPGGVNADGLALAVYGAPSFAPDESALFFLAPRADGTFSVNQFLLGSFHLTQLQGRTVAWRDLRGGYEVQLPGRSPPADALRDLELFSNWLVDQAAGRHREADYFLSAPDEIVRSLSPPFPGCPSLPLRRFVFDDQLSIIWLTHLSGQRGLPQGGFREAAAAVDLWSNDPLSRVSALVGAQTVANAGFTFHDSRNAFLFGDPNEEIGGHFESSGVLAVSGNWFLCEERLFRGEPYRPIVASDVITQDGIYRFFDALADPSPVAVRLLAHEVGHTLGLGHSTRPDAVMRAQPDGREGLVGLDADDLAGLYNLYGDADLRLEDMPRPDAPRATLALAQSSSEVLVTWQDSSDNESNFRIERRRRGELNFRLVLMADADATSAFDAVDPESTFTYRVQAQNAAGRSPYSPLAVVEVPEDQQPLPPLHLWSAALAPDRVRLRWHAEVDMETEFIVEIRGFGGFVFLPLPLAWDQREVDVIGLSPGVHYGFRVRSRNSFGISDSSNETTSLTLEQDASCLWTTGQLCLGGGRFSVGVTYPGEQGEPESHATAVPATDVAGWFYFFEPSNVELMVRLDEPTSPGDMYVLSHRGLSHLGYRISVTDHATGMTHHYDQPAGELCVPQTTFLFPPTGDAAQRPRGLPSLDSATFAETATRAAVVSGNCLGSEEALCLAGRFVVGVHFEHGDTTVAARSVALYGDSGFFSFSDSGAPDVLIKVLDGTAFNGHSWVFLAGFAAAEHTVTVLDTATGELRSYSRAAATSCAVADTSALRDPP
jgi:hypothetical protein